MMDLTIYGEKIGMFSKTEEIEEEILKIAHFVSSVFLLAWFNVEGPFS